MTEGFGRIAGNLNAPHCPIAVPLALPGRWGDRTAAGGLYSLLWAASAIMRA